MEKQPIWTRNFTLCTVICFFYTVYFFMFFTGMTSYTGERFGANSAVAGFTASIFIFGDLVSRMLLGGRINRYGKKRITVVFLFLGTLVSLFYFQVGTVGGMCLLRFVHGLTYGAMASAVNTYVAECLPAERRGEGMGYFMLSLSIGSALGPFMCMYLQENGTYTDIFTIGVVASALGFLCSLFLKGGEPDPDAGTKGKGFLEKSALGISLVVFVFFFSYSGVLSFIAPYGTEIGLHNYAVYFFVTLSFGTLVCRLFLGKLYDIYGENTALIPMFIIFIVGMVILSTVTNGWIMLFSGAMLGLNIAMLSGVGQAIVVRLSPVERYSAAISTYNIFMDLAYGVGPVANGAIIDMIGFRSNYLLMAGLAALSLVLYIVLHGYWHRGKPQN